MYLVSPHDFKAFLDNINLSSGLIPKPESLPCLIEFNQSGLLKAKVEVSNYAEFLAVVKFGKTVSSQKNKYWIRGQEWEKGPDGNFIQEMKV
nr:hypothetical protein [Desulfobacula sp.]